MDTNYLIDRINYLDGYLVVIHIGNTEKLDTDASVIANRVFVDECYVANNGELFVKDYCGAEEYDRIFNETGSVDDIPWKKAVIISA